MRAMSQKQQQKFTRGRIEREREAIAGRATSKTGSRNLSRSGLMSEYRRGVLA